MTVTLVRRPEVALSQATVTFKSAEPIAIAEARRQHDAYAERFRARVGDVVVELPPFPGSPDATFVEDTAVVVDELAVVARPALPHRRAELASVVPVLATYRPMAHVLEPATLEGGDVLFADRTCYVGNSQRTNDEGFAQLANLLAPLGYLMKQVKVHGCLHLKTAVTHLGRGVFLGNATWIDRSAIDACTWVDVLPDEPFAANHVRIHDELLMADSFPKTIARVREQQFSVYALELSEILKAEAGPSCMSLTFAG